MADILTNRARAKATLEFYKEHFEGGEDDNRNAIVDLLADIRHLIDEYQWRWDGLTELALMHYDEERDEWTFQNTPDEDQCP